MNQFVPFMQRLTPAQLARFRAGMADLKHRIANPPRVWKFCACGWTIFITHSPHPMKDTEALTASPCLSERPQNGFKRSTYTMA